MRKSFCHTSGSLQEGQTSGSSTSPLTLQNGFQLGDDFAAADDLDAGADADAGVADIAGVVGGYPADGGTRQRYRIHFHHRRDLAGAAHLPLDAGYRGPGGLALGLYGDLPAVVVGRGAHAFLQPLIRDFGHHTVGGVIHIRQQSRTSCGCLPPAGGRRRLIALTWL
jgi:hypothetical protein